MKNNLSHPELRARDIRKLVEHIDSRIQWDQGCDGENEWVFASLENELYKRRLLYWLKSKNIESSNESILVDPNWSTLQQITWENISIQPEKYFGSEAFKLYDIELGWILEYSIQEVARFGIINI